MGQDLEAGSVTLLQLLKGEREYVSPLFQRRFVWSKDEIDKLVEDIDDILEGKESSRFLGAIVLEIKTAGLAFQPDSAWIVDGQQRLTTLYIFLVRIAIEAEAAGASVFATSIANQYLFNQDGSYSHRPKLTPTLLDYRQFNSLFAPFQTIKVRLQPDYGEADERLVRAAKRIEREVKGRCQSGGAFNEDRARTLVSTVLERLKFVQIVLGDDQDPHQVFDSLNAKGVRLENKDLIRNIVFQRIAGNPAEAEMLYRSRWIPLEERLADRFDAYFFPFGLIHKPSVTKSTLLSSLRGRWKERQPHEIVDDLEAYVPAFNAITSESATDRERITESDTILQLLNRLYRMPVPSSVYAFLMRLITEYVRGSQSETILEHNLIQIESFLVRRAVAGFEPTGLHAVFKDLWSKTKGDPAKMIEEIDKNPTVQFPDDEEFAEDICKRPLYGRKLAKYILLEYERGLRGGDPLPEDVDPTIDHLMPQELNDEWRSVVSQEDHKRLNGVWGNLVLLSLPANSEKGRKTWSEVRDFFATETIFKSTKRLAATFDHWDASTIEQRSEQIAKWAVARWPKQA